MNLKPCPFCGSEAECDIQNLQYVVECCHCGARVAGISQEDVKNFWNKRIHESDCKAQRTSDPPQDCNWPFCGCDPKADSVLATLQECGRTYEDGIRARRKRLPDERRAITHHFTIGGEHDGYITVGLYEDKKPGEIFVKMSKQGSTISGLLDCWAITMSLAIQYGVPLESLCAKLAYTRFEPDGNTQTPLHFATSVVDYVVRWLQMRFIENGTGPEEEKKTSPALP